MPIIENVMCFLLFISVFVSDFIISGIDDIIKPKNRQLISYMFFSNMFVMNSTDSINPIIYPTPILDRNFKAFILSVLSFDMMLFSEFTKSS